MSTSFILTILLFASLHACNAHLMMTNRKINLPNHYKPKNVEEIKSEVKATDAGLLKEGHGNMKNAEREEFMVLHSVEGREETTLASMATGSLPKLMKLRGLKDLQARSMLERSSPKREERHSSSEGNKDEPAEDVEVKDYVHPKRKAPIHNKENLRNKEARG